MLFYNAFDSLMCSFPIGNILQNKFFFGPAFENYKRLFPLYGFQYICKYESDALRRLKVSIFQKTSSVICTDNEWNGKTIIESQQMLLVQHLFP